MNELNRIQEWYLAQCNGEWEHEFGIEIGNSDNPGWIVTIDLAETELENLTYEGVNVERSEGIGFFAALKI